jgi:gamma-glutamylcysteine synthetase
MEIGKKIQYEAKYKDHQHNIETRLSIILFQENEHYIAYAPALDLSGYGYSEEEAHRSFGVALEEFLRYTSNKKTIANELTRLGWKVKAKKMQAPNWSDLIVKNNYIADIMEHKQFKKIDRSVSIPAFA